MSANVVVDEVIPKYAAAQVIGRVKGVTPSLEL